tara:strand:- start:1019 stop:2455 length:1437 start_codon:yes stop_codon:yes gene_type:complete
MLFNSIDFAIFLPIVFSIYWLIKKRKKQNLFLVISSYIFYGWWDWRFLFLIIFSSVVDYIVGIKLEKEVKESRKKNLLLISIVVNLGFLGFFKYYNFFIDNLVDAFTFFGSEISPNSLNIILPVGISFYTFQTLSYTLDIYKQKIKPTRDLISFLAFVSFFPQLVAGPIERASNLLPQFVTNRKFLYSSASSGMKQILWGLFKKIVIADNCAIYANEIFNNSSDMNGSTLLIGAFFFTFQIYGDFSGYSDIAIGTAKLFGFNLMKNFSYPYFSRDIAEFWRRWHISLSSWFRDYLYFPLGGSHCGKLKQIRNTFIIFAVSGFWHGANWTFFIWGLLNAIYFIPLLLMNKNRTNLDTVAYNKIFPSLKELSQIVITFTLTIFAWIFFRAESVKHAIQYINEIFSYSLFSMPTIFPKVHLIIILVFILLEWYGRNHETPIFHILNGHSKIVKFIICYLIIVSIYFLGNFSTNIEFIYFQF